MCGVLLAGRIVRGSCQAGIGDLPDLINRPHLFGHKVQLDYQPALLYCLSYELRRREQLQANANYLTSDPWRRWAKVYETLPQVLYAKSGATDAPLEKTCGQPMDPKL